MPTAEDEVVIMEAVSCRDCNSVNVMKYGKTEEGKQRYHCNNCYRTFLLNYTYNAYTPGVKDQIIDMAVNASGTRDTARVLGISPNTVTSTLKKSLRS